jgi:hypothetical protein
MTEKLKSAGNRLPDFAAEIKELVGEGKKLPPVNDWHPEREGEIDIRIAKDGVWFYQGDAMPRQSIVKLFSGILRKDDQDYFLVTPAEKMKIVVDDAPFVVCMMDVEGEGEAQKIYFSTNVGDAFLLSSAHAMTVDYNLKNEPSPYVRVRDKLNALISRQVYYELAELAVNTSDEPDVEKFGVWSDGVLFSL